MSSAVLPRGRLTRIRATYESTYGTNPGSAFSELHTYAQTFKNARPLVDDDVLGAGFANNIDDRAAAPNVADATATISAPMDLGQIGFWLGAMLGRVSASGTTPKTHSFSSGVTPSPSLSLEREFIAAAQYEGLLGGVIKSMKFPFGASSGYNQVDMELMGAKILEPYASTLMASPTVETLAGRVPKFVGIVKVGAIGSAAQIGSVISGDLTVSADIDLDRYVGDSAFPSLAVVNGLSVDINMTARYNTDVLRAYGALGANLLPTAQELDIVYSLGANLSLTLSCLNVRFEPVDVPVTNGKSMTVSMKGRAEADATHAMLTATLVNQHNTY